MTANPKYLATHLSIPSTPDYRLLRTAVQRSPREFRRGTPLGKAPSPAILTEEVQHRMCLQAMGGPRENTMRFHLLQLQHCRTMWGTYHRALVPCTTIGRYPSLGSVYLHYLHRSAPLDRRIRCPSMKGECTKLPARLNGLFPREGCGTVAT